MSNSFGKIIQNGVEYDVSPYAHKIEIAINQGETIKSALTRLSTALNAKVPNLADIKSIMLEEWTDDYQTHLPSFSDVFIPCMIYNDLNRIDLINISTTRTRITGYSLSSANALAKRITFSTNGNNISDVSSEIVRSDRFVLYYS